MSDKDEPRPNFSDFTAEHTSAQHLARAQEWAALAEEHFDNPTFRATSMARMHIALAAEIDRQTVQSPLVNGLMQSAALAQEMLDQMTPPGPTKKATLHPPPSNPLAVLGELTGDAAETSPRPTACDKSTLFSGAEGIPTCFRSATERVVVTLTRGVDEGAQRTINVCGPCATWLARQPNLRVTSADDALPSSQQ